MIGLVYLIWPPLGLEPVNAFLASYRAHMPGADHELIMLQNGDGSESDPLRTHLLGLGHRMLTLERPVLDLAAYAEAARQIEHDRVCFVNSYSVVLADGWLGHLSKALEDPSIGLAGATASWESHAKWMRGAVKGWPRRLAQLPGWRRDFPSFPNPHLRTTGFVADRKLLLQMRLECVHDKYSAYLLESGRASITKQVQRRGLRTVVVGRDGRAYDVDDWPNSATFRSGGQKNLLVSDNRTRDWEHASLRGRRRLARYAWGSGSER